MTKLDKEEIEEWTSNMNGTICKWKKGVCLNEKRLHNLNSRVLCAKESKISGQGICKCGVGYKNVGHNIKKGPYPFLIYFM